MTWFNWHAPVITPAQAAWCFVALMVLHVVVVLISGLFRSPEPIKTETKEDEIHGDASLEGRAP